MKNCGYDFPAMYHADSNAPTTILADINSWEAETGVQSVYQKKENMADAVVGCTFSPVEATSVKGRKRRVEKLDSLMEPRDCCAACVCTADISQWQLPLLNNAISVHLSTGGIICQWVRLETEARV